MEDKSKAKRRRRAQQMRCTAVDVGSDSCDEQQPRSKHQRPRKKSKEPLFEEDIIDGFAIMGFKNYEDIEVSVDGEIF